MYVALALKADPWATALAARNRRSEPADMISLRRQVADHLKDACAEAISGRPVRGPATYRPPQLFIGRWFIGRWDVLFIGRLFIGAVEARVVHRPVGPRLTARHSAPVHIGR